MLTNRDNWNKKYGNKSLDELFNMEYHSNMDHENKTDLDWYLNDYLINLSEDKLVSLKDKYINDTEITNKINQSISLKKQMNHIDNSQLFKSFNDARKNLHQLSYIKDWERIAKPARDIINKLNNNNNRLEALSGMDKLMGHSVPNTLVPLGNMNKLADKAMNDTLGSRFAKKTFRFNDKILDIAKIQNKLDKMGIRADFLKQNNDLRKQIWDRLPKRTKNYFDQSNKNWIDNVFPSASKVNNINDSLGKTTTMYPYNSVSNSINNNFLKSTHLEANVANGPIVKNIKKLRDEGNFNILGYNNWLHNKFPYSPVSQQLIKNRNSLMATAKLPKFDSLNNHLIDKIVKIQSNKHVETPKTIFYFLHDVSQFNDDQNETDNKPTKVKLEKENKKNQSKKIPNYIEYETKNHAEILANNNWVFPVNYHFQDYSKNPKNYARKLNHYIYNQLSKNNYQEFKNEFKLLIENLHGIKDSQTQGFYHQVVAIYELIFHHPYGDIENNKINEQAIKAVFPTMFPLLEFLNFHNTEYKNCRKIRIHDKGTIKTVKKNYVNYAYFKNVLHEKHLSNYYRNIFTVGANFYKYLEFSHYNGNSIPINRNSALHGKVNPDRYTLKHFMKLVLLCRGFSEILLEWYNFNHE